MSMRSLALAVATVAVAGALVAAQGGRRMSDDPDRAVAGGGALPAGWEARLDHANASLQDAKIVKAGATFTVTTGPAMILFQPTTAASGSYRVSGTFTQIKPSAHPEAYGLFIGGADLEGAGQKYTYFLLRQDGKYLIKRRAGTATPTVIGWTDDPSIQKADANGEMTNALAIAVSGSEVQFMVNGKTVKSEPAASLDVNGVAGLRINHNLDVRIADFAVAR